MRILGILGSLGARSSNRALLQALRGLAPETVEIFDGISGLPFFNPDLDREGQSLPEPILAFRRRVGEADALVISTPEYAHGIPGGLKNALDWLVSGPEIIDKPVGLIFGSASDASFAQAALIEVLQTISARVVPGAVVSIAGVRGKVDAAGRITDEQVLARLQGVIEALGGVLGAR